MAIGLRFTKPGKDISSTDPRDFTIHSDYNILKIAEEGYGEFTFVNPSWGDSVEINHNLGYNPIVWFYYYHPSHSKWFLGPSRANSPTYLSGTGWNLTADITNPTENKVMLEMAAWDNTLAFVSFGPVPYKYFILIEPRKDAWYE